MLQVLQKNIADQWWDFPLILSDLHLAPRSSSALEIGAKSSKPFRLDLAWVKLEFTTKKHRSLKTKSTTRLCWDKKNQFDLFWQLSNLQIVNLSCKILHQNSGLLLQGLQMNPAVKSTRGIQATKAWHNVFFFFSRHDERSQRVVDF